jgi:serine phosphatase RsbU (regulator of sigma subunit)
MSRLFLAMCFFISTNSLVAQDSLYQIWKDDANHDTVRFKAMKSFIWTNYLFSKPDTAFILANEQLVYADYRNNLKWQADAYNTMGVTWYYRSEFDSALVYYDKALVCIQRSGLYKNAAGLINNIAMIEMNRGNFSVAMEKYNQALLLEELKGNKLAVANCILNIGIIFYYQQDYDHARENYLKAQQQYLELGNEASEANALNNLGVLETDSKNYQKAIEYHQKALTIRQKNNDQLGIGASITNIGTAYSEMGDYDQALNYFFDALEHAKGMNDLTTESTIKYNISEIYLEQNRLSESLTQAQESYEIAKSVGAIKEQEQTARILHTIYKKQGDYKKSLEMHEIYMLLNDSISSDENKNAVIRQEYKAEYEKMVVTDSLKSVEEKKLKDAELQTERAENKRRSQFSIFLIIGLATAIVFGIIIYKRLRITREQKAIIEEQKITVTHAFDQLEEKNKEILDSITYAKRIQSAILPSKKLFSESLPNSFVLYKPKDIVAGDFYWLQTRENKDENIILFAAADCTGHGVPGALVSVVCNNALNRSVREFGLADPGKILDRTREIVIHEFEKSDENVKDGMDISLCALSIQSLTLTWAGANNPLWILRSETGVLEEIRADKQPIGKFADAKPFTTHHISLSKGDTIYIFTDGYQDQFGGDKGKKFKASALRDLITETGKRPINEQHETIQSAFENWRGGLEQIDDVCIIGVKI